MPWCHLGGLFEVESELVAEDSHESLKSGSSGASSTPEQQLMLIQNLSRLSSYSKRIFRVSEGHPPQFAQSSSKADTSPIPHYRLEAKLWNSQWESLWVCGSAAQTASPRAISFPIPERIESARPLLSGWSWESW